MFSREATRSLVGATPATQAGGATQHCHRSRPRTQAVRCNLQPKGTQDHDSRRPLPEAAAVLLTGLAATCLTLGAGPAYAEEVATASGQQDQALQSQVKESKKLEAKLDAALLNQAPEPAQAEELARVRQEIKRILEEVENSVVETAKGKEALAAQLASKSAEAARLQAEVEATQKELEAQKKKLAAAAANQQSGVADGLGPYALPGAAAAAAVLGLAGGWALSSKPEEGNKEEVERLNGELQQAKEYLGKFKSQIELEKGARETLQNTFRQLQQQVEETNGALTQEQAALNLERNKSEWLRDQLSTVHNKLTKSINQIEELRETMKISEFRYAHMLQEAETEANDLKRHLYDLVESWAPTNMETRENVIPSAPSSMAPVQVKFSMRQELRPGQACVLVGSHPDLGCWDLKKGLEMTWGDGHLWSAAAELPAGTNVEFKFVVVQEGGSNKWEGGPNHVLFVPANGTETIAVRAEWGRGEVVTTQRYSPGAVEEGLARVPAVTGNGVQSVTPTMGKVVPTSSRDWYQ